MRIPLIFLCMLSEYALSQPEAYYQKKYCPGLTEHVLTDKTRVDCLTGTHAIEFDFARKWAEAIGQSLHYGQATGKKPGIVLIIESDKSTRYLRRLQEIVKHFALPIDVWYIREEPQAQRGNQ